MKYTHISNITQFFLKFHTQTQTDTESTTAIRIPRISLAIIYEFIYNFEYRIEATQYYYSNCYYCIKEFRPNGCGNCFKSIFPNLFHFYVYVFEV